MDIRPGDRVFGESQNIFYDVVRIIGQGSFGTVYEIKNINGDRFALKTLVSAFIEEIDLKTLFNEAILATEVENENVIKVYFFHDGTLYQNLPPYLIMEFAENGTLENFLIEKKKEKTLLSNIELKSYFQQLCNGMKAINEKLVHRDIKPDNILINGKFLKISDFGLSKIIGAATRTQTFKGINHIRYCAPEAWKFEKNSPSMDMYSMGIVFYELTTLTYPYQIDDLGDIVQLYKNAHMFQVPKDPKLINKGIDDSIVQILLKMLAKNVQDRYSSWDDILKRLDSPQKNITEYSFVSNLVRSSLERYQDLETKKLQVQQKIEEEHEHTNIVGYSFNKFMNDTKQLIAEFNQSSDVVKLECKSNQSRFNYYISTDSYGINIQINPLFPPLHIDNFEIMSWGIVKAPSRRGFNLLLIRHSEKDIYGDWYSLINTHTPLGGPNRDDRPEPFPFEFDELPRGISNINSMDIYTSNIQPFSMELFYPLIDEIITMKFSK